MKIVNASPIMPQPKLHDSNLICKQNFSLQLPPSACLKPSATKMESYDNIPRVILVPDIQDYENIERNLDDISTSKKYEHHMNAVSKLPEGRPLRCPPRLAKGLVMNTLETKPLSGQVRLFPRDHDSVERASKRACIEGSRKSVFQHVTHDVFQNDVSTHSTASVESDSLSE